MIKTESEYQECLKRLEEDLRVVEAQRTRLEEMKLPPEQVALAMEPHIVIPRPAERRSGMVRAR